MSATPRCVGIDVAKAQLDIALRPTGARWAVANDDFGIVALVERLQAVQPTLMVLEATGSYQRAVVAALAAAGLPVAGVNPRQARDVAKATGPLAKTDALDARVLAHVAEAVRPTPRPLPDAQADELRALLARRRHLVARRTAEQNRLGSAPHGSRPTSRPISRGSTPDWRRWTMTSTRRGGRVRYGGHARTCAAASPALARSVHARCGSTCRRWGR
jgi:hypothetical protein